MDYNQPNYPYQPNTATNINQDPPPYMAYTQYPQTQQQPMYPQPNQPPFPPTPSYPQVKVATTTVQYEETTLESLLKMNRGKVVTAFMTFPDSKEFNDKIFKGVIESVGKDHFILSDPKNGKRFVLLYDCVNWVEFDDEIKYDFMR